jgi:hypothetical protein
VRVVWQNVTTLLSTLSTLTSTKAEGVGETVANSSTALRLLLGDVRADVLSQVSSVAAQVNTLIARVSNLAGAPPNTEGRKEEGDVWRDSWT